MKFKRGFNLIELMIAIAISLLLASFAIPVIVKCSHNAGIVHQKIAVKVAEGGDTMFRFAEMLIIFAMLYIVTNLFHYAFMKASGWDEDMPMSWLFGLSRVWLRKESERKNKDSEKERKVK